jgi:hypothetical protein
MADDSTEILLRLDVQGRDIKDLKRLAQEHVAEQKKTNGRVTDLERATEIEEALRAERAAMLASHRRKWEFMRPAMASALGGLVVGGVLLVASHAL